MQYDIQDRRKVYAILEREGIEIPRYAVLDRDSSDPENLGLIESEDRKLLINLIIKCVIIEIFFGWLQMLKLTELYLINRLWRNQYQQKITSKT
jgi:hypothetical protein